MTWFDRFRERRQAAVRELGAVEAALWDGRPSSDDRALQALQAFALKLRAAAPEPDEAFLKLLDERFRDVPAGVRLAETTDEEPEMRRSTPGRAGFRVRVLVAEDHRLVRDGVVRALERDPGIEVVGEADDGVTAMELARQLKPDVIVLDLRMPGPGGAGLLERLRAELPEIRALVMTANESPASLLDAVAAGAAGYLSRRTTGQELRQAVITTYGGGSVITPEVAGRLLGEFSGSARAEGSSLRPLLADRELEILRLAADGLTDNEIAKELYISPRTVQNHLTRIREKLGSGRTRGPRALWTFGATAADEDDPRPA